MGAGFGGKFNNKKKKLENDNKNYDDDDDVWGSTIEVKFM